MITPVGGIAPVDGMVKSWREPLFEQGIEIHDFTPLNSELFSLTKTTMGALVVFDAPFESEKHEPYDERSLEVATLAVERGLTCFVQRDLRLEHLYRAHDTREVAERWKLLQIIRGNEVVLGSRQPGEVARQIKEERRI